MISVVVVVGLVAVAAEDSWRIVVVVVVVVVAAAAAAAVASAVAVGRAIEGTLGFCVQGTLGKIQGLLAIPFRTVNIELPCPWHTRKNPRGTRMSRPYRKN